MTAAAAAARTSSRRSFVIIAVVAMAAMAPELLVGLTVSDSYRFTLLWPEQFDALFRAGHWYPRWLPLAWNGFGSPVFYFYPPLFFWVTAVIDTVTGGVMPVQRLVPLGSLALMFAAGVTMRAWLRSHAGEQRALLGAAAYVLAPYHLYDIYARGALAEASAYASVPLVMLALARLGEGRTRHVPLLSLGFAVLLVSHLPTALLVSLFLIPPYVLFTAVRADRPLRFVAEALVGGLIGVALAAIYWVPALSLLRFVSPSALSSSFYRPENWFFWRPMAGPMGARLWVIVPVSLAAASFAVATILGRRKQAEPLFWALLIIVIVALIAGLVPPVWQLPGLKLVQFPFRALLIVEFATVTMLMMAAPPLRNLFAIGGLALLALGYAVLVLMIAHTVGRTVGGADRISAELRSHYLDAPEYLPAGTRIVQGKGPDDVQFGLPPAMSAAAAAEGEAKISASDTNDGGMTVLVDSHRPTRILLHRFYFPHWRLTDASGRPLIVRPSDGHLVSFEVPAGQSLYRLSPAKAPTERMAALVTLLALALVGLAAPWAAFARLRQA